MPETFNYCPAPGVSLTRKPRLAVVAYGDGYRHRMTMGINVLEDVVSAVFNGDQDYINAIHLFLSANYLGGFYWPWASPDPLVPRLYTCDQWQLTWREKGGNGKLIGSIQAEFTLAWNYQPLA